MEKLLFGLLFFGLLLSACVKNTDNPMTEVNPLFESYDTPFGVPPFEIIKTEHYMPAIEKGMKAHNAEVEAIANNEEPPTFENTFEALDKSGELLNEVTTVFFHQTGANTTEEIQAIEMDVSPKLAAHRDAIRLNPKVFERINSIYENKETLSLTDEQMFLLENQYKGFVRNGANLNAADKETLKSLNQQLSKLTVQFSQNVLAETNDYKLVIEDKADLAGLPESVISGAAADATAAGMDGKWVFTTQKPSMIPFLQYADNRNLRRELYHAYTHRGDNGNEYDNNKIMAEIVKLRAERAQLLGYETHSNIVLEPRMAGKPENVLDLLDRLWDAALPIAKKEKDEMQKIIDREGGDFKLEASDWWYYAEKLRKEKYDLDDSALRPYFKLENVRDGAFAVATKLFGITFSPITKIPLPHPDAQAFEVKESDGSHLGVLYMDFHPRESKQQGAWCGGFREHKMVDGKEVTPIVNIVCNFTKPDGDTPALLSMDEVETLFHEFGHGLDGLFAETTYNTTYIAWDFVELPSQIMEHWVTEPEVLNMYAKHYKTGEVIPTELVEKVKNSSYFNQGFETVEYLAASLLDIAYHTQKGPLDVEIREFEKSYLESKGLIPEIISRYRSTYFNHITGGYDSGYYSYIWAGVLDNDVYEAFSENGIFDQATASSYRKNILEKNGIMNAMEMFVNFRGREPDIEPLLRNRGLK